MKKFVTTTLLGLASAACALSLTACGETKEISYTVTEDEWKSAITSVYDCGQTVQCVAQQKRLGNGSEGESVGEKFKLCFDSSTKTVKIDLEGGGEKYTTYIWADNGNYYQYLEGEGKCRISEKQFTLMSTSYANGALIALTRDEQSFANATYDGESKQYKGSCVLDDHVYECSLKFENGKLVQLIATDEDTQVTCEYKYEKVSVTLSDEIKNLPSG